MKLLVTGGTGFLGKHIVDTLFESSFIQHKWAPNSKELNLNSPECIWSMSQYRPDVILHMAAVCGGILANKNSPADFLHKNMDMASNVFKYARDFNVKYVYTLGSVCAYPKFCPVPFKEDDLWNGYPEETNAPYGISKRLLLMLGQTYRQQYGIGGAHLIPVNMYGEHDHFDLTNSHVIPALIRKFDDAITQGTDHIQCWGTGNATREFLYAGDCATAIVRAIEHKLDTDLPINLGVGKEISILDLSALIGELMGFEGKILFNSDELNGQPRRMLDVTRAKQMLNWEACTSLQTGLKRTIEWYRQNKKSV
jgi:GDP-L-fucose synthase